MIKRKAIYKNQWIRMLSISMTENWQSTSNFEIISPIHIAKLESNMAHKLNNLPLILKFSVQIYSIILRFYCCIKYRSISFSDKKKRKLLSDWFMKSENPMTLNYRLFIEKFTILYLMQEIENAESSGEAICK